MEPLALRMRTRDETGSGRGNLTKFAFSKFLKFFQNFLKFPEKFLLFLAQNIFQTEFFMAASVRARSGRPKNMLISGFRCMWLSSRRGSGRLWILANRAQPVARRSQDGHKTVTRRSQVVDALKSGGQFFLYNDAHS